MKLKIFDYRYCLIPLAIPFQLDIIGGVQVYYRTLLIFGVRLAYWTVKPFKL